MNATIICEPERVPVLLNKHQLARELQLPLCRVYGEFISPDALDLKGSPLFALERLREIRRAVSANAPEVLV
ncbi:MAG: hypothetical protein HY735_19230 [Verrucomicrobia bacterium]|nr:hypothetical protein [Verrucomicrobiota bacterium]